MTLPLIASLSSYGAPYVDAVPQVDPTSELASASANQAFADIAGMTATATRCLFQFTAVSSGNPVLAASPTWSTGFDSVWGNSVAYQPSFVRTGTGAITVHMPTTIVDSLGNTLPVNVRAATANIMSGSTPSAQPLCVVTSSSTFTISLFSVSGSASDFTGALIFVETF